MKPFMHEPIDGLQIMGNTNADSGVSVLELNDVGLVARCRASTGSIPSTKAGYAVGCQITDTTTGYLYTNTGSITSCNFTLADTDTFADNAALTLGTTQTTPATYKKIVYDSTTTGLGLSVNGTSAVPQIAKSTSPALVKVDETATTLPAAATSVTDFISDYRKIYVTGAGVAAASPVVSRAVLVVGLTGGSNNSAISEGYIRQDTLTKGGTGTVSSLKGHEIVIDVGADNFTATNGIQGLNVTMDGSAVVGTGKVKGISIDINGSSKVDVGLQIAGAPVEAIKLGDTGPSITSGSATTDSGIKTAMGITAPAGSIYISTNGTGEIWVMLTTTWTKLTIN